jgi:hypothetical protein
VEYPKIGSDKIVDEEDSEVSHRWFTLVAEVENTSQAKIMAGGILNLPRYTGNQPPTNQPTKG